MNATLNSLTDSTSTPRLKEAALRDLITAVIASNVIAKGIEGGFILEVSIGNRTALLGNSKGDARIFASLETMAVMLKRMGVNTFFVDATNYVPGLARAARPERSKEMREGRLPKKAAEDGKTSEIESVNQGKK